MRIGLGHDLHQLVEGRKLFLGGIEIASDKGLLGHSDADVLLHAVCDAMLGAAGLGDIGEHFPDTDPKFKDISSVVLLRQVYQLVGGKGHQIENIDCTIFSEAIKIAPYKVQIRENISDILCIPTERINIKAKTNEKLGPIGEGKAIAASCAVLLT
ncbi:MAG: 2-C-methyl-D-erythritol 2,4-cyclodiphosphate synthase [PVC group bacterium]|nr:2-C-methyl-D-erythritol 2,4-cyclodiphosphate synthase [PVC group bacterium]